MKVELFSELFASILILGWVGYNHELLSCENIQLCFDVITGYSFFSIDWLRYYASSGMQACV